MSSRNPYFDDDDDETSPLYGSTAHIEPDIKAWDVFRDPPTKTDSGSEATSTCIDFSIKLVKVLIYILSFVFVLGFSIVSKGTMLFMTSQIAVDRPDRPYCNKTLASNNQFFVTISETERVSWIWVLIFAFMIPELGTFIRSLRICAFKTWSKPKKMEIVSVFITESLPTIGTAIMVFVVLPKLDAIKGVMITNAVCFIPGILNFLTRDPTQNYGYVKMVLDVVAASAQVTALIVWPVLDFIETDEFDWSLWLIPVSMLLISFGWWENYVSSESHIEFIRKIGEGKKKFPNSRYYIYVFASLWKIALFLISVMVIFWVREGQVGFLFDKFSEAYSPRNITLQETLPALPQYAQQTLEARKLPIAAEHMAAVWVLIINFLSSYLCYICGKYACKILIQQFGYAFPINLSVPVTMSILSGVLGLYRQDPCNITSVIPYYLFYTLPTDFYLTEYLSDQYTWMWILWLLSQTWITLHIWTPGSEKLARTEKLFVRPMYDAFFIDQSLALNRRRDDKPEKEIEYAVARSDNDSDVKSNLTSEISEVQKISDSVTRIYACGTMWHENKDEMMEFLKSIFRLDADQSARRIARKHLGFTQSDYYELETHIFFDDAFIRDSEDDPEPKLNEYVKLLVATIDDAASNIHQTRLKVRPPKKYPTPYGGRLVWTLPGKTKMYAHLKDKKKIRPKKRWSQVMYMYYLLGHKLMEQDIPVERKDVIAENTYILALDGDIDFQPDAMHILITLMKRDLNVAAACGRIHPIGSGPMVWYQMFEYAVGHWLQKATEHVIGCVLCSPGCFSLFRAKSLMDDSVMRKYTTKSDEARHYVQYDQGEDRWLCTLLLQQGYRVEYSAASDAYTHCPEGFNEFYNQRRRWMPSTIANILDLLMDSKRTIKVNDSISRLYIWYQIILMVGTVLGPGTIFLMLVGAFVAAFQIDNLTSFIYNLVPILLFMFVCFLFKSDVQLFFAGIISALYGLVMMAVLVGVMLQIRNDGIMAPSSLFFMAVAGEFVIAGILHPKEIICLPYGLVYYVTVPSMYLLLVLYSVFNMNNVSWGTREVTVAPKQGNLTKQDEEAAKKQAKKNSILSFLGSGNKDDDANAGSFELSVFGIFKCMLCTHKEGDDGKIQMIHISDTLQKVNDRLERMERLSLAGGGSELGTPKIRKTVSFHNSDRPTIIPLPEENMETDDEMETESDSMSLPPREVRDDMVDPYWLQDPSVRKGETRFLYTPEIQFWNALIDKYLHPIDDTEKKGKIEKDLKDLRDKAVFGFFMLNALFVLVVFLLTLKKELINVKWPLAPKRNITYIDSTSEIHVGTTYLELEPIGFVFLIFFALLLVIQFIAMLFHRFGTLSQILIQTKLNFSKEPKTLSEEKIVERDAVRIAKQLQSLKGFDEDDDADAIAENQEPRRRKTLMRITRAATQKKKVENLDDAFRRRIALFQTNEKEYRGPVRRETMAALTKRKDEVRRKSVAIRLSRSASTMPTTPNNNGNAKPLVGYLG